MNRRNPLIRTLLIPFSILYGTVNFVRNKAFDLNILKSKEYDIPTICVGNITVGGTGKTPHIEYLISQLSNTAPLATLSRGYKRESKGFKLASYPPSAKNIGDEPAQIKTKFPDIIVAVDSDRRNGIYNILKQHPETGIILLDDAYQHRYVKAKLNILLIDYNRPIFKDFMLPAGDLREFPSGIGRADIVIITKCPSNIELKKTFEYYKNKTSVNTNQIYFSHYTYKNLISLASNLEVEITKIINKSSQILVVTGIASPKPLAKYLSKYTNRIKQVIYPDHHNFTQNDIKEIQRKFDELDTTNKTIITTEKDYSRLKEMNLPDELIDHIYYLPIKVKILNNKEPELLNLIKNYVTKDS